MGIFWSFTISLAPTEEGERAAEVENAVSVWQDFNQWM